jgi:carboxyl-terminal processing protease
MSRFLPVFARRFLIAATACLLALGSGSAHGYTEPGSLQDNRARLLAYVLKQHLETYHFSHKKIDDSLSEAAFALFLKQLDSQKKFLLREDVKELRVHSDRIDDEIAAGKMELAIAAERILGGRISQVQEMAKDILSQDFDFSEREYVETDPDKIDYCISSEELRERWRKTLKQQVLHEYLFQEGEFSGTGEDAGKGKDGGRKEIEQSGLQESARKKVSKNYETLFPRILKDNQRESYDRFFGAVTRAFDPHTVYMPPDNKEDFDISMRGSFEGIGATLEEKDGYIKVVSIVPGGPAFLQGQLDAEDFILGVAEGDGKPVDLTDMRVRDAVKLIRGKKGTEVRLTVRKPEGRRIVIPILRDVVQLSETFAKGAALKDEKTGKNFGYIKLPSFYRDFEKSANGKGHNATEDMRKELKKLGTEGISGLILDLRNNGGGALSDAVSVTGLFIRTGPVLQVKNSSGKVGILADEDPDMSYTGPMIVLVNKLSASASEILAGALQDYGRAVIMGGEHTHGKGTVQVLLPLEYSIPHQETEKTGNLGAIKVTVQKFYRISGESTQYKGVIPDIVLPDRWSILKSGEQHLEHALPWDTISPAQFDKFSPFPVELSHLREMSEKRVKANQHFSELRNSIEKTAEHREKTLRSLQIDDARREREEEKADRKDMGADAEGHLKSPRAARARMSEEERHQLWLRDIGSDAYVQEAIAVLTDIVSSTEK